MLYLNQVTICGNIGKIVTGDKHAFLDIAVNRRFKDKDGETKTATEWLQVKVFKPALVKFATDCGSKGAHVYIDGFVQSGSYEKDGEIRYSQDLVARRIEFVQPKPKDEED